MLQTDNNENGNKFMLFQFLEKVLSQTLLCHNQMTHWPLALELLAGGTWIDKYMADSDMLMKAIKDIKNCVKRMADYIDDCTISTTFVYANPLLDQWTCEHMIRYIRKCITAALALQAENAQISAIWKDLKLVEKVDSETILSENSGCNGVIYTTRYVCKTLLLNLLYGLVYCWEDYKFKEYVYNDGIHFDSSFMVSTNKLKQSVESEIRKLDRQTGILWYEFRISRVALKEFRREYERISEGEVTVNLESEGRINEKVKNLTRCVEVLKDGTKKIIEPIDILIDEIIELRYKISGLA